MKKGVKWMVLAGLLANLLSLSAVGCAQNNGKDIALETPSTINIDLSTALKSRHSSHDFQDRDVTLKQLSTILWAANGVNRDNGKRTTPAPFGKYVVEIYVSMKEGVFLYQPNENKLRLISEKPINDKASIQGNTKKSSHLLVLVGKTNDFPFFVKKEERISMINAAAGCIAQNVYLAANSMGLGTRLVETINARAINEGLGLDKNEVPLYIMPVGYPKE